jgi:ribosome-associated toxin RatA of RatAB toxin-antitoxin module
MSTPIPAQPETPQPQRVKKRIYIPLILLVLLLVVAVVFYVRGTWADKEEHNPSGPDAGTITQLLERPNKNVVVRCAVVVDAPPKDVWAVINDYASHKDFLPYVTKVEATPQKDGKILIDGVAYSRVWQEWPFESLVTNKEDPDDGEYSALWSEEGKGEYKVNRGGWTLKPLAKSKKQTLLEFSLQIEMEKVPNFLVRNIIMDRLHSVLKAMRDETLRRRGKA